MQPLNENAVDPVPDPDAPADDIDHAIGVYAEIGRLPPGAIVELSGLARIFGKHRKSIQRAIERGELPAPTNLFEGKVWTAKRIVDHFEKRLDEAAKEVAHKERTLQRHTA